MVTVQTLRAGLEDEIAELSSKLEKLRSCRARGQMTWRGNGAAGHPMDARASQIADYRRLIEERQALLDRCF